MSWYNKTWATALDLSDLSQESRLEVIENLTTELRLILVKKKSYKACYDSHQSKFSRVIFLFEGLCYFSKHI